MNEAQLLEVLKDVVVATSDDGNPSLRQELTALRARLNGADISLDSPLGQFGWDSIQMTWVLVRLEERLGIDTSSLSLFNLFTVGDLLRELMPLVKARSNGQLHAQ